MKKYLFPTLLVLSIITSATLFARPAQAGIISDLQDVVLGVTNKAGSLLAAVVTSADGLKIISDGVVTLKVGENNTVRFNGATGNATAVVTLKSLSRNQYFTHWTKTFTCSGTSCTILVPYNINVGTMVSDEYPQRTSDIKICDANKKCDTVFVKLERGAPLLTGSADSISSFGQVLPLGDAFALDEAVKVKVNITPVLKSLPQYKGGNIYIRVYNYEYDRYSLVAKDRYTVQKAINGADTVEFTIPASDVKTFTKEAMAAQRWSGDPLNRVVLVAGLSDYCPALSGYRPNGGWQMELGCEVVVDDMQFVRKIDSEFSINSNDSVQIGALNRILQRYDYTQSLPAIVDRFTSETETNLKAFQAKMGIAQTGRTDAATREKLAPLVDIRKANVAFTANKANISGADRTLQFELKTAFNTNAAGFRIDCKMTPTLSIKDELGQEYCNKDVWREYSGTSFKLNLNVWYDSNIVKEPVVIVPIMHLADKNKRLSKYELAKKEITIVPNPAITLSVTSPAQGQGNTVEAYTVGASVPVRWVSSAKNMGNVTISLADPDGKQIVELGTAPFANGVTNVILPEVRNANYTIRVTAGTNVAISKGFLVRGSTIPTGPVNGNGGNSIVVTSPNGGETYTPGQTVNIKWTAVGITPATKVTFTHIPDGATSIVIGEALASAGTFAWTIPANASGSNNKVGVTIKETPIRTWDTSDQPFTITKGTTPVTPPTTPVATTLTVTTPNGGESFITGERIPVRWVSNMKNTDTATIYITGPSGSIISTLTTAPFKNGLAYVKLPNTPGNFKIMVSSGTPLQDTSDSTFAVTQAPVVTPPTTPTIPKQDIPNSPLSATTVNGQTFYESFGDVTPEVSSISRTSASSGDTITLTGKNFTSSGNTIYIDTLKGSQWSVDANATDGGAKLTFKVGAWQSGWYYVYVFNENGQSNFKGLYIKNPAGANIFSALWSLLF